MIRRRTITSYEWHVATGNETVVLLNCVKSFFRRLELIGNSVQLTTTGKNLFDIKKASDASNYITTETLAKIDITAAIVFDVKKNTNYCLSVSGKTEQPSINFNIANDVQRKSIFNKLKTEETLNSLDSGKIYVGFSGGDTELNATKLSQEYFDIQLEEASSKTPYEPYTGLKPSPSPEYPQEIKNVGRKSKNLLDINYFKDKNNLQTIQCEGFSLLGIICNVKPNTEYTLSANLNGAKYNLNIANKTKRFSLTSAPSRTLVSNDDGTLYIGFYGVTADNVNMDDFMQQYKNIQLEEGNKTAYEPYSDKYLLDVKVNGKNLFDREKARDISNWIVRENDGYAKFPIRVGKGNKVTFSYTEKLTAGKGFYLGITQSETSAVVAWLYHSAETNLNNNKHTVVAAGDYIYLSCTKSGIQKFVDTIQTLQVEISDGQTPYELYTEQTLTITSDRPLTKWDKLVEQGGQYGWLYGSKIYVVTGNEVFESRDGYNIESYTNRFFILNDLLKENDVLKPLAYMKCLRNVQYVYSPNIFEEGFETNINQFHIKLSNDRVGILASDDHAVRTAKFSGYMKKIHKNGNPIEILYATTDTVFLPLPESVQQQLQALHSENGTTHVFVDSGEVEAGINIEYKYKS